MHPLHLGCEAGCEENAREDREGGEVVREEVVCKLGLGRWTGFVKSPS